ncbi:hypothetical protein O2W14_02100 [Modestobacter sp. VKM Ac-2986]|uniref:hypothetical protein n=1 Tax=Modestobacter sp. VKM Ac-2986 TaxID=3004140 RepID=UPI0022AACCAC|nr:hypothetical protein [Modestobacter sp. VKM Ac-2986]MCZ2827627.1 hypothetical protein [Modestobacter sp. VKM Ac-2986]
MSDAELRRLVDWTAEDPPPEARVGRVLGGVFHAVSAVMTLGADAALGARPASWAVPSDPADYLGLGVLELRWPDSAPAEPVEATRQAVWVAGPGRPARRLPVDTWRVVRAVPGTGSRRPRQSTSPWRLELTDGSVTGSLTGAWLALAWIGHLAGWPEPVPSS